MKIDRSNYETWFIDLLDGNLNDRQVEQLNLFLSENPDLKEELKEMNSSMVTPPVVLYIGKPGLKKTPSEISDHQFDYLCAAYAENDLSPEELDEFSLIANSDPIRRNISEQFMKLKLKPHNIRFENKRKLLKRTPLYKTIRLSVVLFSAAASLALLITLYFALSKTTPYKKDNITQLITNKVRAENPVIMQKSDHPEMEQKQQVKVNTIKVLPATINKTTDITVNPEPLKIDTPKTEVLHNTDILNSVKVLSTSDIMPFYYTDIQNLALITLTIDVQVEPDQRWAPGRFFAKVFRERILREETTDDSPIKGYEIAEAGVTGLNKLLGWEMAFEKNIDANGELKSLYFSSKILKIQAPVNKSGNRY